MKLHKDYRGVAKSALAIISVSLLSPSPVFAELTKTVYISSPGFGLPLDKYANCRGNGRGTWTCTARKGYIFWEGRCGNYKQYVQAGYKYTYSERNSRGNTEWCLRAIRQGEM